MRFTSSSVVAAPPARVFEIWADVAGWPAWTSTVRSARLLDGPLGPGARVEIDQPRLPRTVWTVTEWDDGASFAWAARGPGVRTVARHTVRDHPTGAHVTAELEQRGPLSPLVLLLTRRLTQRYLDVETASLARHAAGTG